MVEQPEDVPQQVTRNSARDAVENRYAHLPPPIRREDLRTSHDVVPHPEVVGEADRERDWLLRTTGIFI